MVQIQVEQEICFLIEQFVYYFYYLLFLLKTGKFSKTDSNAKHVCRQPLVIEKY